MPLLFPLAAILLGTALLLLRGSLSEELLLAIASTLFFGAVFGRLRPSVARWLASQADELRGLLGSLLELRLLRLGALLGLGRRLLALVGALDRLLPALAPLFVRPFPPSPLLPLAPLVRELVTASASLDRATRLGRLRLLAALLAGFAALARDRFALTPR